MGEIEIDAAVLTYLLDFKKNVAERNRTPAR
jgi:hypothetical protein